MSGSNSSAPGSKARGSAMPDDAGSPLSFTVHSVPTPALGTKRTTMGRIKMMLVLAVCAAPVVASYVTYFFIRPDSRSNYSELILPPVPLPESLPLLTLSGEKVAPSSLRGQWLIVVVADAACDSLCENNLFLQRQLRETLGRESERIDKVWFITDNGAVRPEVHQAVSMGHPAMELRVPRDELAQWLKPAPGQVLENHLYVIDPMGQWMMRVPLQPEPSKLKKDIERLLRASASWDQPGR